MMVEDVRVWDSSGTNTKSRLDELLVLEWRFVLSYQDIIYSHLRLLDSRLRTLWCSNIT